MRCRNFIRLMTMFSSLSEVLQEAFWRYNVLILARQFQSTV